MRIQSRVGIVAALSVVLSVFAVAQPAAASAPTTADLPGLLTVAPETTTPAYSRDRFDHWIDADEDGCNTRYEVLIEKSTTPVTKSGRCTLSGGTWVSPYDGFIATEVSGIEIDHVVALAEAWRSGASAWDDAKRQDFANDIGVPYALVASSSSANQSKADRDPAKWMPSDASYHCEYVTGWALTKYRWSLTVDEAERNALASILTGDCAAYPVTLPTVMSDPPPVDVSNEAPDPTLEVVPVSGRAGGLDSFGVGTTRLAGNSRYETAISASRKYQPGVPVAFIATGAEFPDALSAAAAAALIGGPLLLTDPRSLPASVRAEIIRLSPAKIYVVGGTGAVHSAVESALSAIAPVTRLGGASRYETGLQIVNSTFTSSSHAILATGSTFPDALAATGAAGAHQAPVVLVDGTLSSLDTATMQTFTRLGVETITITGGTGVVSSGIEQHLRTNGYSVTRYGGQDRYETTALINQAFFAPGSTDTMFLATGQDFPDALAAAALAGRLGAPLYITIPTCVPSAIHQQIAQLGASKRVVMGGQSVVSNNAAANTLCAPPPTPTPTPTPKDYVANHVTSGAFCAATVRGWYGYTSTGILMQCKTSTSDNRLRWRAV